MKSAFKRSKELAAGMMDIFNDSWTKVYSIFFFYGG